MRAFLRVLLSLCAAALLSGCVAPADFDGGDSIRALNATAADLTIPKTIYFATTRCNDRAGAGQPGTAEELFAKRCWAGAAAQNAELARLGFGIADGPGVTCGTAAVTVAPFDADKKAASSVSVPVAYDCTNDFATLRQVVMANPCKCALVFV